MNNTLIQITQDSMGNGDQELGQLLIANYLKLINEESKLPRFIALYNSGVKLICKGSPVIEQFKVLEQAGVKLIACKTCLNHFNILETVEVGIPGTMIDIIELQKKAEKVINL